MSFDLRPGSVIRIRNFRNIYRNPPKEKDKRVCRLESVDFKAQKGHAYIALLLGVDADAGPPLNPEEFLNHMGWQFCPRPPLVEREDT